ncbi:hypothetical protein [Altibacter sp.]|uniref:hypothetical protein n=1 Tax=Altibacter sp. TaxID=2024823 RepID=UPI000C88FB72|nr:hypothetical protein [Altibacter sp.]MAP53320.1 hypothetical protein [Altibacter sp.]
MKDAFMQMYRKVRLVEKTRVYIYIVVYLVWGVLMNYIGILTEIAKFTHWWQIIPTYIFYMVPISIVLKEYSFFTQYAYGLVAMGILEFGGYAFQTSYIYPNNILDRTFGPHVFALGMALFFALYFPLGNTIVHKIYSRIIDKK